MNISLNTKCLAALASGALLLLMGACGNGGSNADSTLAMQAELDSLREVNEAMQLEALQRSLDSIPVIETEGMNLAADQQELLGKYNEARSKIEKLMAELKNEKAAHKKSTAESQAKIKELESQIASLKDYCKDLLQRLQELNEKYEQQVQINTELTQQNEQLTQAVGATAAENKALSNKVAVAEKLTLTGISLHAYNKRIRTKRKLPRQRNWA